MTSAEHERLEEARRGSAPWKKWGPYLSERQCGTGTRCEARLSPRVLYRPRPPESQGDTIVNAHGFPRHAVLASLRAAALLCAAALCLSLASRPTLAADQPMLNEKFADLEPAIQMLRSEIGQDRREIVKSAMLLTQSEAATFWPLYDQYRADMHKLGDRRVKLISDFIATRNTMSEEQAEELTKEALSIEDDAVSTRRDWVKKMSKALSARTVARFFQIDAKLDAAVNAELASSIPLIH